MRLWSVKSLQYDILNNQLSQKEIVKYWIFSLLLQWLLFAPIPTKHIPEYSLRVAVHICNFAIVAFGFIACYRANGGSGGDHLLDKFTAISFLAAVRGLVFAFILPALAFGLIWGITASGSALEGHANDLFLYLLFLYYKFFIYFTTARNLRSLRMG